MTLLSEQHTPLLRAVAAWGLVGAVHDWPDAPLAPAEWSALVTAARSQRLGGLLAATIHGGRLPATGQQDEEALQLHLQEMGTVLRLEAQLLAAAGVLAGADIEFRVLKGSAAAHLDYADVALRSFVDVDLLVRGNDFDRATAALTGAGYQRRFPQPRPGFDRRFSKGASFGAPDGAEIDLHRTFVMGPFGLRVALDDLWSSPPEQFDVAGQSLPALSAEGRFMHACFHAGLGDVVPRLVPQRDLAQLLLSGRLDPAALRGLTERWQAQPVVAFAVRLTWTTLAIADIVGMSAWAHRYRPSPQAELDLAVYHDPDARYAEKSLAAVRAIPGWRDRAAFVRALALPDEAYLVGRPRGFGRLRRALVAATRQRGPS